MPKNGNGGLFAGLRLSNRAQAIINNRDRNSEFKVTQNGLDSILGNSLTTQKGLGRQLTRQNQRTLDAMARTSAQSAQRQAGNLRQSHAGVANLFGSATAGDANLFRNTAGSVKATGTATGGMVKAGQGLAAAGDAGMNIFNDAAKASIGSGNYELGQALQYRASADAKLQAANQSQLEQMRLQNQLTMANERFQQKLATAAQNKPGGTSFTTASQTLLGMAQGGQDQSSVAANAAALAQSYGMSPSQSKQLVTYANSLYGADGQPNVQASTDPASIDDTSKEVIQQGIMTAVKGNMSLGDVLGSATLVSLAGGDATKLKSLQAYAAQLYNAAHGAYATADAAITSGATGQGGAYGGTVAGLDRLYHAPWL